MDPGGKETKMSLDNILGLLDETHAIGVDAYIAETYLEPHSLSYAELATALLRTAPGGFDLSALNGLLGNNWRHATL
jgi:hypothetical protein